MPIPRLKALLLGGAIVANGSWALAQEPSRDQSFLCTSLCPGSACPQTCKGQGKTDKVGDKTNNNSSDGPGRGSLEAIQPGAADRDKAMPDNDGRAR